MRNVMKMTEEDFGQQSIALVSKDNLLKELCGFISSESFCGTILPVVEDSGVDLPDPFTFQQIDLVSGLRSGQRVISRDEKMRQLTEDGYLQLSFRVFLSLLECDLTPPANWRTHAVCFDSIAIKAPDGSLHTPTLIWCPKEKRLYWETERVLYNIGVVEKLSAVIKKQ